MTANHCPKGTSPPYGGTPTVPAAYRAERPPMPLHRMMHMPTPPSIGSAALDQFC